MVRRNAICVALFGALYLCGQLSLLQAKEFTTAEYEKHIAELRKRLPSEDFTIVLEKPFVVIGDETPPVVRQRASGTIRWAVRLLKQDYFSEDPDHILDIWLFKDKASYETNVEKLFKKKPTTPFGYYSSQDRALVMNISTGSGTLVHEIVHPLMESNFEDCPSWFNEGLASLYEACGEYRGRIYGYTNWRLRGLHKALDEAEQANAEAKKAAANGASDKEQEAAEKNREQKRMSTFGELCSSSTREFYGDQRGTNYAQARYLCYYLQQRGLLRTYYHAFRRNAATDPSGYKTLVATLGSPDMDEFQQLWQTYVRRLEVP